MYFASYVILIHAKKSCEKSSQGEILSAKKNCISMCELYLARPPHDYLAKFDSFAPISHVQCPVRKSREVDDVAISLGDGQISAENTLYSQSAECCPHPFATSDIIKKHQGVDVNFNSVASNFQRRFKGDS